MRGNHRFGDQLCAPALCHLPGTRRRARLVIKDGKAAICEPVDPVGTSSERHRPGWRLHLNGATDLSMAVLQTGPAA